jgi:hypothetical protein
MQLPLCVGGSERIILLKELQSPPPGPPGPLSACGVNLESFNWFEAVTREGAVGFLEFEFLIWKDNSADFGIKLNSPKLGDMHEKHAPATRNFESVSAVA